MFPHKIYMLSDRFWGQFGIQVWIDVIKPADIKKVARRTTGKPLFSTSILQASFQPKTILSTMQQWHGCAAPYPFPSSDQQWHAYVVVAPRLTVCQTPVLNWVWLKATSHTEPCHFLFCLTSLVILQIFIFFLLLDCSGVNAYVSKIHLPVSKILDPHEIGTPLALISA